MRFFDWEAPLGKIRSGLTQMQRNNGGHYHFDTFTMLTIKSKVEEMMDLIDAMNPGLNSMEMDFAVSKMSDMYITV